MPKTVPCLWFDGQAEQAAAHYTVIFPDSKVLGMTRYGPGAPMPEGSVMTVSFSLDGQEFGPCGWLKDRFGVSWQVVPTVLPELIADPEPGRGPYSGID